jgi:benzil reductase ((S)-benzoin forming)
MTQHLYILTGGSRGMGLAIAEQLLQAGNTLICISRNQQASLTAKAQQTGAHLAQWTHDLADGATASLALKSWLEKQTAQAFQSATLINNAGVIPHIGPSVKPILTIWPWHCAWV